MSRGTPGAAASLLLPPTGLSPSTAGLSSAVPLPFRSACAAPYPAPLARGGLGSSRFARRYFGNHFCFLFLRLLRCFSSPGSLLCPMDSRIGTQAPPAWVPPFRHLRISGYLPLPAAFRSLSRLSSALSAKASALCPFQLSHPLPPSVGGGRFSSCPLSYRSLSFFHSSISVPMAILLW